MPERLRSVLVQWAYDPVNIWKYDDGEQYDFSPTIIPYDNAARDALYRFRTECIEVARTAEDNGDLFKSSLYKRCYEIASKLALLARRDSKFVGLDAVQWALELVRESTAQYYEQASNYLHDSAFSKKSKEVERYLKKKAKWVTLTELHNRFRIPPRHMQEILDYLEKADIIDTRQFRKASSHKKVAKTTTLFRYNIKLLPNDLH
jgi:hypothetical protein